MSDLNCNEFVELVTAYLEGKLDPDNEQRFVEHLALCDGCARYLEQIQVTVRTLGELPAADLKDERRERLLAAFRDRRTN
ncbi:MAG TPA: zf-HC2 domain-containing protein [Candidatus Krumholzibacteria bacterium]|nr:zf-HC2 domain-containing protein [Candidatus Krumholzibacteria bacterium]